MKSKSKLHQATFSIDGVNEFQNATEQKITIRARGNSTYNQPKKPYLIKFNKKQPLLGFPEGKKWVLLANYQDGPLMSDMLAMKVGNLLNMKFTPKLIPIELTLNGKYQGVYWLTPHKEVAKNRINIGKDGQLLELTRSKHFSPDKNSKFHYLFTSENFMLPVLIRYPKLHKEATGKDATKKLALIKTEFNQLDKALFKNDFKLANKLIDKKSIAQLLLVHQITKNGELNHPKSIYLHKTKNGKYTFGPIWDFDWAYGASNKREYFKHGAKSRLIGGNHPGGVYFNNFLNDAEVFSYFKNEWDSFKDSKLDSLQRYMYDYVDLLKNSGAYQRDYDRWHIQQDKFRDSKRKSLAEYHQDMNNWLTLRSEYIDLFVSDWEKRIVKSTKVKDKTAPIINAGPYKIYLQENKLIYHSDKCSMPASTIKFFLHLIPKNINELPVNRQKYKFDNLDFQFNDFGKREGINCTIERELPKYKIKSIKTGQYNKEGRIWQGSYKF